MDDTWRHVKCSSSWTPPPSSSSPATASASASSSANQIDMNLRPIFLPFIAQGASLENRQAVQDPLVFHTLNLDFAKSGKNELGNSFLSLLYANPHRLPSEFSQLSKPHAHGGGIIVSSASPTAQPTTLPTLSQNRASGSMRNAKIPLFDQSEPSLIPHNPRSLSPAHMSLQGATSHCIRSTSSELNPGQGSWPSNSRPENIGQHHSLNIQTNQILQRMSTEAGSCVRSHDSAHSRGRPRVFCMKTVGEMFLSELGLLGVICFCHNQRMSVAKFCEHSSSSANPGDAVRLENGMTVAQWRKLCFGNNAPDDGKGWDWSDRASAKNGFIGSKATLPQNPRIVDSIRTAVSSAISGDPVNKSSYAKPPCSGVTQVSIKQPTNKGEDFTIAPLSHVTSLARNHTKHGNEANPHCLNCEASHGALDEGESNVLSRLVTNSDNSIGKLGTGSIIYPHSDATSLSHEFSTSRNSFASEAFIIAKDGKSSNIDLRLGQPSQVNTSLSYVSTGLNQMQFSVVPNPQKSQVNLPLTYKSDYPMETKEPKIGFCCKSHKQSTRNRGQCQQAVVSSNTSSHSEPKELVGCATKNSLVSMFLSHLNSKGSSASHLTTTLKNGKHSTLDPAVTKHNFSEDTNDGNQKNPLDGSKFYDNLDKGKRPRFSENGFCNTVKANHLAHNNQIAGTRVPIQTIGGKCLQNVSPVDDRRFSLNFNQPSRSLQPKPDTVNFIQYGKVPLGINNHFNCATNGSIHPFSYAASRPVTLNSGTPMNTTSSDSLCISETASVLAHVKSTDHSHHLTDSMKFLASRHMVDFSRKDHSTTTFKGSSMHQRLCCHSSTLEDITHGSYSDIQQNASSFAVRSVESCSHCFSGIGAELLATKPGIRGRRESCNCTTLTQRNSQCSKEHNISTCHVCCASEHPCLSLGRLSNCGFRGAKQTFDQKEHAESSYGKCCCSMIAKHLPGCCLSGDLSPSDSSNKQTVCRKAGMKHITQACDDVLMFEDEDSVRLCECTKKQSVMKNGGQIGLWKDVPAKKIGHSDATSIDKPAQVLDFSKGFDSKGFEGEQQGFDTTNEQQMSNACSGSSAPAVTEISVEVNKGNYCPTNGDDNHSVADEGSGVEKCGSSDEALGIREYEENPAVSGKADTAYSEFFMPSHLPDDRIDERRQEITSNKKKVRKQMHVQGTDQENIMKEKVQKEEKTNEQMQMNQLSMSVPKAGSYPINSASSHCVSLLKWELSPPGENSESKAPSQRETIMGRSSVKRKRSSLSPAEPLSAKINNHDNNLEIDRTQSVNDDHSLRILACLSEEEELTVHREKQFAKQEKNHLDSQMPSKYMSLNCIAKSNTHAKEIIDKKVKPVVCGKSGIISNGGMNGLRKPAKIVSLSLILKRSKRCGVNEYEKKPRKSLVTKTKKMLLQENNGSCNELPAWKLPCKNENPTRNSTDLTTVCLFGKNSQCFSKCNVQTHTFSVIENETNIGSNEEEEPVLHKKCKISQARPKYREVSKLLGKDNHGTELSYRPNSGASCNLTLKGTGDQRKASPFVVIEDSSVDFGSGKSSLNNEEHVGELSQKNVGSFDSIQKCQTNLSSLDAFCCVCGSLNKDDINCLLQCNLCLINVHQACYGVSKVPQGHWFCRPCKTNSQNTACVLCGYDGGAMTRALKSQDIIRSLLKAWNFGTFVKSVSSDETVKAGSSKPGFIDEASEHKNSVADTAVRSACSETFPEASMDIYPQIQTGDLPKGLQLCNSITAGVFDPSVTQWVHMVCGLWTPGTRCPNVDTMNAFDVSGATAARKSTVCSVCNRPGGCCIQCRVPKCRGYFHPWCAHQKGLLQSEIEGENNEKVGFYGRCMLHAAQDGIHIDSHPLDVEIETPRKDWSCARIEGFKGRKSEDQRPAYSESGGCIVSQEQINAWQHINGQKPCARAGIKRPSPDIEHDFWDSAANPCYWKKMDKTCIRLSQKEYLRYKQSKTWKHLVVYKSGIHALGLYTSQPIVRGAMVVEYVGEVVGLRVADRREIEYQSGRRVQHKSACYFFRIDKEHIIDATRKGGIARFVNHSCEPNCVAKVISVRNEKEVVFFAERDINPGEEITYDYHFNSEDEGEKIPCCCNSKNCRRYLN